MNLKDKIQIGMSILKCHLFGKKTPIAVYLAVTDACNLKCRYCNIPDKVNQNPLTLDEIKSMLDEAKSMGCKRLQLTGGEPMLRNDIEQIIDYAKSLGLYVTLSSNGFQVKERINELKNLDTLFFSIDGFKAAHDNHKGQGTWNRVIEAARTAKAEGINVWATTVISQKNYKEIADFLKFMKKEEMLVNIHLLYRTEEELEDHFHLFHMPEDMIMTDKAIRKKLKELIELKKQGAPIASSYGYLQHLLDWDDYSRIYSLKEYPGIKCWAGKLHCYVDTDGRVYACGDSVGRKEALNLRDVGFRKAFNNITRGDLCNSCIVACNVEQNLMFSLNIKAIWNWLRKVK